MKFRYANTNSESNGVSVKIEIKQGGDVVKEYTLTKANSEVVQNTVYTETIENINVAGTFQIVITNLSPSNNTGNKDRVSIGRFCWSSYDGPTDLGSYQRDVTAGRYGTICLPKAGKLVSENVTLYEISYKESNDAVIYLDEVDPLTMEAGMPYIFFSNNAQINVEYTSSIESTAKDNNGLHGTLVHMDNMSGEGIYMISNNQIMHFTSTASWLDENRAYIQMDEVSTTVVPKQPNRRRVTMNVNGEQTATGIGELNLDETPMKLIINGQLIIIRGEKMFNANGQLVK